MLFNIYLIYTVAVCFMKIRGVYEEKERQNESYKYM